MSKVRPMPADFAEMAMKFERSTGALQGHYSAGQKAVYRWLAEAGIEPLRNNRRPVPADFAEVAPTMCVKGLTDHYQTKDCIVKRWIAETGVTVGDKNPGGSPRKPCPEGFEEVAPTLSLSALSRYYAVSHKVISRWLRETGTENKPYVASAPKPRIRNRAKGAALKKVVRIRPGDYQIARTRVKSIYDDAADILRAYTAVYRCDDRGRFDVKGRYWRMGNVIMTPDELLERAARKRAA